jgi:putative transposase
MDNQFDATEVERPQMCLNVIKEENIYCPALRVGRCCKAKDFVVVLEELTGIYPALAFIRSEYSPELNTHALQCRSTSSGTTTAYIEPKSQ